MSKSMSLIACVLFGVVVSLPAVAKEDAETAKAAGDTAKAETKKETKGEAEVEVKKTEKKSALFDYNRLAISASGRAYHSLLFGVWDKKDGQALQYEVKGEKYLAFKPTVGSNDDGDTWVEAKVGRFRAHVQDDVAIIKLVCAPSGILKSAQVTITMLKRDPFDSGAVTPGDAKDRKAATKSVVASMTAKVEKYLADVNARKGRKYMSVVVKNYLKAMSESVKGK